MKTINEILLLVKAELEKRFNSYGWDNKSFKGTGLCFIVTYLHLADILSSWEVIKFRDYLKANHKGRYKDTAYFWKEGNYAPRIKFLDKHIALTDPKTK